MSLTVRSREEVLRPYIDFQAEKHIYSSLVQQIIPGGERRRIIIAVTEFFIHLYLPNATKSDLQFLVKYPLRDVTKLDALDEVTFRITFGREILTVVEETKSTILGDLYHNLSCYQHRALLPQIDRALISDEWIDLFVGVQKRYRACLAWQGTFVCPETVKSIDRLLKRQPRVIDLGIIEDLGLNVRVFLDAISIQPAITTIVVPPRPQSGFYEMIWHYVQQPTTVITTLTITESVEEDGFYQFLSGLTRLTSCSLQMIHFESLEVPPLAIDKLSELLAHGRLRLSLSFTKCVIRQCEDRLNALMEQELLPNVSPNLIGVHMTTVWLTESAAVKNAMLRLQNVSMRGCSIKADEILTMLPRAYPRRVEVLDLSRNQCVEPFKAPLSLPVTLSKLVMDNMKWDTNNLIALFKLVCGAGQLIHFSCVHVDMDPRRWKDFFQAIDTCPAPQLTTFVWTGNPVHAKLCQLLLKAGSLKVLCIGGLRLPSDTSLQRLLAEHKTLEIVDMHGTSVTQIGPNMKSLLTAIKRSKSIRRIDVSHNKMGPQAFARLVKLIVNNQKIQHVLLDDNDLPNYASFDPLVQAITQRGKTFFCRWPEEDMALFSRAENFTEEKLAAIRSLFRTPESPLEGPGAEEWLNLVYQNYPESVIIAEAEKPTAHSDVVALPRSVGHRVEMEKPAPESQAVALPASPSRPADPPVETPQPRSSLSGNPTSKPVLSPVFNGHAAIRSPATVEMDFVDVPPIDNTKIYAQYQAMYNIQALTQRLRSLI
jgi:hypothetical protein